MINRYSSETNNVMPKIVFIELTRACNLKCDMCRYEEKNNYNEDIMSKKTFEIIEKEIIPHVEIVDLRGWGESLLLNDFHLICNKITMYNKKIRIVSNLSLTNNKALIALAKADAIISISLDAIDPMILSKIRKNSNFSLIDSNITLLRSLYKKYNSSFENVYIGVTVQERNVNQISSIVEYAAQKGIKEIRLFPRQNNGEIMLKSDEAISKLIIDFKKVKIISKQYGINIRIGANLYKKMNFDVKDLEIPCIKPWLYAFISWDGYIGFCDYLIGPNWEKRFSVGNINKSSFYNIWNSKEMKKIRLSHLKRKTKNNFKTSECHKCYETRYVDFEDIFEEKYQSRIIDRSKL